MRDFLANHFHDLIAGLVTLTLTVGVLALYAFKGGVPGPISSGWQLAMGFTFGVGAGTAIAKASGKAPRSPRSFRKPPAA